MTDEHERVVQSLQTFASTRGELARLFARSQRLHTTDAAAIVEIINAEERGQALTPARLAERLALTTGATSTLLNRLEDGGFVSRSRGHSDRRMVTLHATAAVESAADAFFDPLAQQLRAATSGYSAAELALVGEFVDRLRATMTAYMESVDLE
ncbi:MarR family winged helix-turn-helix transcriptional regulator [Actinoplanes sp. HUAS TT8]|uniref:MarR family winged helix-turn-helix transcriptional regulator n=1 Tax=Actinoplanes sp. HUAS TT8 TaxID=3447453 RepID=UPI003F525F07